MKSCNYSRSGSLLCLLVALTTAVSAQYLAGDTQCTESTCELEGNPLEVRLTIPMFSCASSSLQCAYGAWPTFLKPRLSLKGLHGPYESQHVRTKDIDTQGATLRSRRTLQEYRSYGDEGAYGYVHVEQYDIHMYMNSLTGLCGGGADSGLTKFASSTLGSALNCAADSGKFDTHLGDYSRTDPEGNEAMSPENPGPCYTSRAFAMAHIAMYDAYVGVTGEGNTYLDYKEHELVSFEDVPGMYKPLAAAVAAGAAAAYSLEMLYKNPDDLAQMKDLKSNMISIIRQGFPQLPGLLHLVDGTNPWPTIVAESVRKNREGDGSDAGDPFVMIDVKAPGGNDTYAHVPDPLAEDPESGDMQFTYAPHWGKVQPFLPAPLPNPLSGPPLDKYLEDFKEVKSIGELRADEGEDPARTKDQTRAGIFWAYDGGFRLGAPLRLLNQVADDVITDTSRRGADTMSTGFQLVRLYAMINLGMAEATIAAWRDKYRYNFWRPIIGIRRANEVDETAPFQDTQWVPLGAPNTNRKKPGINPAFPAYPSGHSTIATAMFSIVRDTLEIPEDRQFEFVSDEFSGRAVDDTYCAKFHDCVIDSTNPIDPELPNKRPYMPRILTIQEAIVENIVGRVYIGVHWMFDQHAGATLGAKVAESTLAHFP